MKSFLLCLFVIVGFSTSQAQYSLRASMGIDFANTPSLNDYINQTFPVSSDPLGDFNTAINFSGEFGYSPTNTFQIGLELSYLLNSFTYSSELGKFELDYNIISPALLGYYILNGAGYNFKFGGGLGIRFVSVDLYSPGTTIITNYSGTGYGLILRTEGNTLLGGDIYANIGADLKYDIIGPPESGSSKLYNSISREDVNLNSLSVGLRLGVSYIF
jgi:hypothetical protein